MVTQSNSFGGERKTWTSTGHAPSFRRTLLATTLGASLVIATGAKAQPDPTPADAESWTEPSPVVEEPSTTRKDAPPAQGKPAEGEPKPTKPDEDGAPTTSPSPSAPPDPATSPRVATPRLHHAPLSRADSNSPCALTASVDAPQLVKRILAVYQSMDGAKESSTEVHEVEFKRGSPGPYIAMIPAADVHWPKLGYSIEFELLDGTRQPAFATRSEPFEVEVIDDIVELRERALLDRIEGRRSAVTARAEWVSFGQTPVGKRGDEPSSGTPSIEDNYYRIEGEYSFRPLRHVMQFGLRAGIVRGQTPTPPDTGENADNDNRYAVGLNYGAPHVVFRITDSAHLRTEFLTSVTEQGFALGVGGALALGDPLGSRLTLGFEGIQHFGTRIYSRLDLRANDWLHVAPVIEITNMPNANRFGVRLIGEVGLKLPSGFVVAAQGGYQARDFKSGGPSAGTAVSYNF